MIEIGIIYGPVPSWRLGNSLGVDPICRKKVCSFDCVYCQLGRTTKKTVERGEFVKVGDMRKELAEALQKSKLQVNVITFSGTGEPELASNLGELIEAAKSLKTQLLWGPLETPSYEEVIGATKPSGIPVAVLTNSFLMYERQVRRDLCKADIVFSKLDAPNETPFEKINQPHPEVDFDEMLEGMRKFRGEFDGKYGLQMMFLKENKDYAEEMAGIAREIQPDEIQLNTPLRPCSVEPLSSGEMREVEKHFQGLNHISVYEAKKFKTKPLDLHETLDRRPGSEEEFSR